MPWVWRPADREPVGRLPPGVVARPLPDRHRAARGRRPRGRGRALDFLFERQQKPDGCFPQNSTSTARSTGSNLQLDQVAFPIVLAWQLGRTRRDDLRGRQARRACILANGPADAAGALGEPERLVAGDDRLGDRGAGHARAEIARANGDTALGGGVGGEGRRVAGEGRRLDRARPTGPTRRGATTCASPRTATRTRARRTTSATAGPTDVDQRKVVDPSFLELVRLGVKRADDPHDPLHAARGRRAARRRHAQRALLAPLQLRRLRRAEGRQRVELRLPGQPDARSWARTTHDRADLADLRGRARRVRARRRAVGRGALAAGRDGARGRRRPHDPRAGLGPVPPVGLSRASRRARRRCRPRRWRGRTRSSCASRGRSTPVSPVERPAVVACRYAGCGYGYAKTRPGGRTGARGARTRARPRSRRRRRGGSAGRGRRAARRRSPRARGRTACPPTRRSSETASEDVRGRR